MSETTNYKFPLYDSTDKPNLRDQYNGAINMIDAKLSELEQNVTTLTASLTELKTEFSKITKGTTYNDLKNNGFLYNEEA